MQKNVGSVDKLIRLILGVVIIILGFVYKSWWGLVGLIPIVTALVGICPLYSVLKVCTIKGCSCKSGTPPGHTPSGPM